MVVASPSTRISLATAGLFVSDESSGEEKEDEKRMCGLGAGLMQLALYEGEIGTPALPTQGLLPQPPSTTRESSGLAPPRPGPPGPVWGTSEPMNLGRPSRTSSTLRSFEGPVGPVGSGSNLGSRPSSRPPSVCGSVGGSRATSPAPCANGMVIGVKELAVLAMLKQGMDLVGDHMGSRINRRLDDAHVRMHALETRFSSLRSAIRYSLSADEGGNDKRFECKPEHQQGQGKRKTKQIQQSEQQQGRHERIALSATSTNRMQPNQRGGSAQIEASCLNLSSVLPVLAPLQAQSETRHVPTTSLWGGALVELFCQDSASEHLATVSVSVEAPWHHVREVVLAEVQGSTRRLVDGLRFADGSGGSIGLTTESSWVLCKALRSLKPSPATTITCVLGETIVAPTTPMRHGDTHQGSHQHQEELVLGQAGCHARQPAHVTFKSSPVMFPVMLESRGAHLPQDHNVPQDHNDCTQSMCSCDDDPAARHPSIRKKKMSDMKPPPMKRKGQSGHSRCTNPAPPAHTQLLSLPKFAKKKVCAGGW